MSKREILNNRPKFANSWGECENRIVLSQPRRVYLRFEDEKSNKYYECWSHGDNTVYARYGRIDAEGNVMIKDNEWVRKTIPTKLRKGYWDQGKKEEELRARRDAIDCMLDKSRGDAGIDPISGRAKAIRKKNPDRKVISGVEAIQAYAKTLIDEKERDESYIPKKHIKPKKRSLKQLQKDKAKSSEWS